MDVAYLVSFNGSVTDTRAATPIVVSDGDQATADIVLQPVPAVRVPLNADIGVSDPSRVALEQQVLDGPLIYGQYFLLETLLEFEQENKGASRAGAAR